MKIKSYFAGSVEQAIQEARQELGTEAMLITSRRASLETRHLGSYEVVFGIPAHNGRQQPTVPDLDLNSELQVLRSQLDDIKKTLQWNGRPQGSAPSEVDELHRQLLAADLDPLLAREISDEAANAWQDTPVPTRSLAGLELLKGMAAESIRQRLRFAPEFGTGQETARTIIFAGPPGAGKTTTLTKVAIQKCLAQRLSVRMISVEPHRVAGHEKLRILAGILGVGFTAVNTIPELTQAVDESRNSSVLLIDTPGYSANDLDGAQDLATFFGRMGQKEIHLVLPASMKRTDLTRCVQRYADFNPDYLLFTKLDETESMGAALSVALETAKPLSYFATGQSIPEDLEGANSEALLEALFTSERVAAISAA